MTNEIVCTVEQGLSAARALEQLAHERLPIKAAWHLGKLRKAVAAEVVTEFDEKRRELIRELGEERQPTLREIRDGHPATLPVVFVPAGPKLEELQQRVKDLLAVEVTIPLRPLELPESLTIAQQTLDALGPFVMVPGAEETTT
jgi:hypothetical protein